MYNEMPQLQKIIIIGQIMSLGEGLERPLRALLSKRPYSAAFVFEHASRDSFKELGEGNGYQYFINAVNATTIYEFEAIGL